MRNTIDSSKITFKNKYSKENINFRTMMHVTSCLNQKLSGRPKCLFFENVSANIIVPERVLCGTKMRNSGYLLEIYAKKANKFLKKKSGGGDRRRDCQRHQTASTSIGAINKNVKNRKVDGGRSWRGRISRRSVFV